jgi:hypothetical protein
MKRIALTRGKVALVDDADFEWLRQWKWHALNPHPGTETWYAYRATHGKPRRFLLMHREILGTPNGLLTDHRDRNGLNNQRSNLRVANYTQNVCNRGMMRTNTSGFIGVFWSDSCKKWKASIENNGTQQHLGVFIDKEDAARAYDASALRLRGEFAVLNFPPSSPTVGGSRERTSIYKQ